MFQQTKTRKSESERLFRSLDLVSNRNVMDYPGMMDHILQCVIALNCMQSKTKKTALQASTNLVFKEALLFVSNGLLDEEKYSKRVSDMFNDNSEKDIWFPLYWAVLLSEKVGIDVVKSIYKADPMAITASYRNWGIFFTSPVDLFCTSESFTIQQYEIFNFFARENPKAFQTNICGFGALHILASYSKHMTILRAVTQLLPNEVSTKYKRKSALDILMGDRFLESDVWLEMVEYLLQLDNSPKVVYDAVVASFENIAEKYEIFNNDNEEGQLMRNKAISFISNILNNCPASVTFQGEGWKSCLLAQLFLSSKGKVECSFLSTLTRIIISVDNDVIRQRNGSGYLPIHFAASSCGVDIVSLLIDEYPESATAVTSDGNSILTCSFGKGYEQNTAYVLERYPEQNRQYNEINGLLPLHYYLETQNPDLNIVTLMSSSYPEVVKMPTEKGRNLPLHLLLQRANFEPISKRADIFRLFLRLYPASANIRNNNGTTPYDLAVNQDRNTYFIRLLLRADPSISPQELHRLNYQERRMALFISSGVVIFNPNKRKSVNAKIWKLLRTSNTEVLREVISFL